MNDPRGAQAAEAWMKLANDRGKSYQLQSNATHVSNNLQYRYVNIGECHSDIIYYGWNQEQSCSVSDIVL